MISEGSWDTEDWSIDADFLPSQEWIAFENILKLKTVTLNYNNISQYIFYRICD